MTEQTQAGLPGSAPADDYGDGIQVGRGRPPAWLRWYSYALWLVAVVYLLLHPIVENAVPVITAAIVGAWIVYTWLTRRPLEP
ncbi:MAG: hypothetical protein HY331_06625 [Chloroflexi bacterium]|nr:hypothetical protein [Chloroflexota bacterium]